MFVHNSDVAHEWLKMVKTIMRPMKNRSFSKEDAMSVITFRETFRWAYDAYRIQNGKKIGMFKQYLAGPAEAAVRVRARLVGKADNGCCSRFVAESQQ